MNKITLAAELVNLAKKVYAGTKPQGGFIKEYYSLSGALTKVDQQIKQVEGTINYYTHGQGFEGTSQEQKSKLRDANRMLEKVQECIDDAHSYNRKLKMILTQIDKLA